MKTPLTMILSLGLAITAHAEIAAIYEFTNNSTIPTTFGGVTGTAFTNSPQLANGVANNNLFSVSVINSATSPVLAVTTGQYFQFTITSPVGKKLHYQAIAFEAAKEAPNSTGRGWVVRASVDNFGADLGTQPIIGPAPAFSDFRVDLPSQSYSNVGDPVTFRIYTYAANQLEFVDYDNIQIFAAVDAAPQVAVTDIATSRNRVRLRGTASDDTGVSSVTVGKKLATGTTNWRAQVRLKPGANRIRIFATDDGGTSSAVTTVRVKQSR
jgi:hypothetical protein